MRLKLLKIVAILLVAGSGDGRPQKFEASKVEDHDTKGLQPVVQAVNVAQEPISVGKDLPQIVQGNSRYRDERRATRRRSYVKNNLFYEDQVAVDNREISDSNREELDLGRLALKPEVSQKKIDESEEIFDKSRTDQRSSNRNAIGTDKLDDYFRKMNSLRNNDTLIRITDGDFERADLTEDSKNRRAHKILRNVESNPLLIGSTGLDRTFSFFAVKNSSRADKNTKFANLYGERGSQQAMTRINSRPDSLLPLNPRWSFSGLRVLTGDEQTSMRSITIRPEINAYGDISEEKLRNFVNIMPSFSSSQTDFTDRTHDRSNLDDRVSSYPGKTRKQESDRRNSTVNKVRVKPLTIVKSESQKADGQLHRKENSKNNVRVKPIRSKNSSDLNFKNWPNDNLENLEDLFNYEKYTSFHDGIDDVEVQETASNSTFDAIQAITQNTHEVSPSVLILEHSLPVKLPLSNDEQGVTANHDSESAATTGENTQEVQWQKIHEIKYNSSNVLALDLGAIPAESLASKRPVNLQHDHTLGEEQLLHIAGNNDNDEEFYEHEQHQPVFENPNLEATENNFFHLVDSTGPASEQNEDEETYEYQNGPVYSADLSKHPYFNPVSTVSQNTVVHILNAGKKRPNVTVTEMKIPHDDVTSALKPSDSATDKNNSSMSTPNVHIMFTMQEDKVEENGPQYQLMSGQQVPEVTYDNDVNCPTITINSYTRINNTIQGKEGCTDLNIIINSHVLNTNVFNPAATSNGNDQVPILDNERYPGSVQPQPTYATSDGSYEPPSAGYDTLTSTSEGLQAQGEPQGLPVSEGQLNQQVPGTSIFEVFQQTQINVGSQDEDPMAEEILDQSVQAGPSSPGNGMSEVPSVPDAGAPIMAPGSAVAPGPDGLGNPSSLAEAAEDPGVGGAVSDPLPGGGILQSPLEDAGPLDAAEELGSEAVVADDPVSAAASGGSSGPQLPGINNPLSGIRPPSQLLDAVQNLGSQGGSNNGGLGLGGGDDDDDDDDDDEDMVALMPFSIMESMASVLPFITFLNPLNYGFLSIAISPFAVAAAGLLGLAALFVPFAIPSVLNLGRAADRVTIRIRPSLEDRVKRSIDNYENWNDWKSKRKKRRR